MDDQRVVNIQCGIHDDSVLHGQRRVNEHNGINDQGVITHITGLYIPSELTFECYGVL
jgi:hypothetical protein